MSLESSTSICVQHDAPLPLELSMVSICPKAMPSYAVSVPLKVGSAANGEAVERLIGDPARFSRS
jgi:hypothetical protein